MPAPLEYLEFVHLPTYQRSADGIVDEVGQREIEQTLIVDPEAGDLITGTGGVRKLRVAIEARGKRGGARLIYYYRESKGRIYLILIYPKSRKDDLTSAERKAMKKLTAAIEGER